jgi:Ser/Thr protein kinase RdoA (MazF antagonist)
MAQISYQSEDLTDGSNSYLEGLPWEEQEAKLRRLAEEALTRCGLRPQQMRKAGHMGNFGYSDFALATVTEGREPSHLTTVHYPYDGFAMDQVQRQVALLCSWLVALGRDTELDIQVPLADQTGALGQLLDHRPDGPVALCTVQRWVKGRDIAAEDVPIDLPPDTMHELGMVLGHIHHHGCTWARSNSVERIRIDWMGDVEEVQRDHWGSRKDRNITQDELALLRRTIEAVTCNREARREPWGLAHGDFRATNCVEDEGRYKPIDFDLCALTYQFDDIGWFFVDVEDPDMRRAFLDGYVRVTPQHTDFIRLVEGALIAARTRRCAWGGKLPVYLIPECEKYLSEEAFLFGPE